jgi:uncharacterized MnhB-related membrane protein
MNALLILTFVLAAASATGVVLTRKPRNQVVALALNGLILALLFMALQAPDVAYSEIAVGTAIVPLMFVAALMSLKTDRQRRRKQ